MIEETLKDIDISELIIDLLEYEKQISIKKINNEELTEKEYFFDTYIVKPSTMVKFLLKDKEEL